LMLYYYFVIVIFKLLINIRIDSSQSYEIADCYKQKIY